MKKLLFLSFGITLFLFSSCKDDDNDTVTLESQLVDTWIISEVNLTGTVSFVLNGDTTSFDMQSELAESTAKITLAADGTFESIGQATYSLDLLQNGTIVNSIPPEESEPVDFSGTGTWSVNENDEIEIDGTTVLFEDDQLIFVTEPIGMFSDLPGFIFDFQSFDLIYSRE